MIWNDDTEKTTGISREEKYGRSTIAYVDIVRCKDCFYGEVEPDDNSYFFCTHPLHKLESHESSYFCADGEAK